jgi:hypothetical protein
MTRRFRQVMIVAALVAYALLLAELCVRVLAPQPLMPRYVTGTSWGVRGNIPGARYRHKTPEVNVEYRINSQGLRADRDYPLQPVAGLCRIGLVGDSYFVGYEVDLENTVAHQLELALQARGLAAEVLNFSVSGFGTAEMLRTYEGQMRRFSPDLVIMQWHVTDLDDNIRSDLYRLDGEGLRRGAAQYLPSVALQDWLMKWRLYRLVADNSQLYSYARESMASQLKTLLVFRRSEPAGADAPGDSDKPITGVKELLSARLLRESMKTVTADGADFLVVDIPEPHNPEGVLSVWSTLPGDVVSGVPVLHAGDTFLPMLASGTKLYFKKGHFHLTPVAATALAGSVAGRIAPLLEQRRCTARR